MPGSHANQPITSGIRRLAGHVVVLKAFTVPLTSCPSSSRSSVKPVASKIFGPMRTLQPPDELASNSSRRYL